MWLTEVNIWHSYKAIGFSACELQHVCLLGQAI